MNVADTNLKQQEIEGLTESEALKRRSQGLANQVVDKSTRSYGQILRENVFTFINVVLFGLGLTLVSLGRISDAIISIGVILVNIIVNMIQELRAKRILDHIALITRPKALVLRQGLRKKIDPGEIVLGDILVIEPGDQIVVDGPLVGTGQIEVDESLLTGETNWILKQRGDQLYSGSFCVTGSAVYQAEKVGKESLSFQMTTRSRAFRRVQTPLQQQINLVVRVLLLVAVYFEILQVVYAVMEQLPFVTTIQSSVVVLGLVPNGLFLAIATAYTLGAVRVARKGALVQQANAIESLSNVDLVCLDKTGTLTTNRIYYRQLQPYNISQDELSIRLGDFTSNVSIQNATTKAIAVKFKGQSRRVVEEIPFSSEYKWSALAIDDPVVQGIFVLGAPEILSHAIGFDVNLNTVCKEWTDGGFRVLAFAYSEKVKALCNEQGLPTLPEQLTLLGLICLGDELRPGIRHALEAFRRADVRLKIISGDNPNTVAALASQAGFDGSQAPVSGLELVEMDGVQMTKVVEQTAIFGRITPQQKEQMVKILRDMGYYVAMIGDGVNDVLSLKQANLAVALESGSQATRSVADLILLNDSFTVLPEALSEGQRILTGMQDILKLFLTRIVYIALLILSIGFAGSFPMTPKNSSLLVLITVGIPSIALASWARPELVPHGNLIRRLVHFVLPAGLTLSLAGFFIFLVFLLIPPLLNGQLVIGVNGDVELSKANLPIAQSALTSFSIFCGLLLVLFVEPPGSIWVVGQHRSSDKRPTYLAVLLAAAYLIILSIPAASKFFDLAPIGLLGYFFLAIFAIIWAFTLRWVWRSHILDRFLNLNFDHE
ncbi:MAG: HAD-IC family P-type ATPase [Anaerolineaceae bacterium]|nr:HAD-IC family P-type ATPase [Anaerolineaceae bacterium]